MKISFDHPIVAWAMLIPFYILAMINVWLAVALFVLLLAIAVAQERAR